MTNPKITKQRITELVLTELKKKQKSHNVSTAETVLVKWWTTGRQEGLRLTAEGMESFKLAEIEFYDYPFKQDGKSYHSFILNLSKKIKCPYYLGVNKIEGQNSFYIRLFDSKIAMLLNLYGNLNQYLDSVKDKK
jgi:hypothetical protein